MSSSPITPGSFSELNFGDWQMPTQILRTSGEILVNTTTANAQEFPQIATLANGDFAVTWVDGSRIGSLGGDTGAVRAQVFTPGGTPVGQQIAVTPASQDAQESPDVTALTGGRFVLTWGDKHGGIGIDIDVKEQLFEADGTPVGSAVTVNTVTTDLQHSQSTTALAGGGYVVTWNDNSSPSVKARIFDANGTPTTAEILVHTGGQEPHVATLSNGFVIAWLQSASPQRTVETQRFDANGATVGSEMTADTVANSGLLSPDVTVLSNGGYVVTWMAQASGASDYDIKARAFDAAGTALGSEFLVNTATTGDQSSQKVTALSGGGFVVTWNDNSGGVGGATGDNDSWAVKAQVFDAGGTKVGSELLVNTATAGAQDSQQIVALSNGDFVVTWDDNNGHPQGNVGAYDVKAQVFDASGTKVGSELLVNTALAGDQLLAKVTALSDGGFAVTWQDGSHGVGGASGDTDGNAIKAQIFSVHDGQPAVANDFNHDGLSDILWRHSSGAVSEYQMNGTTILDGGGFVSQPATSWSIKGTGDFNGDGFTDILWHNLDGTTSEYQMNGTAILDQGGFISNPGTDWNIQGVGDFNGDGLSDILWRRNDGTVREDFMHGTSIIGGGVVSQPSAGWNIQGVGDFNGDGHSDILWRNNDGTVAEYLMNGTDIIGGGFVSKPGSDWTILGVGDFNGDHHDDILWRNTDGTVSEYLMNGTAITGGGYVSQPGNDWTVQKVADYNGDGHADILWRHDSGVVSEYLMNGTTIIGGGFVSQPDHSWVIQ
jgi:hypothetical protein